MQKKTRFIVASTVVLLTWILIIGLLQESIESIFGVLLILWIIGIISTAHYFIFIKPRIQDTEDAWVVKDMLIRSTYWRLLCVLSIVVIVLLYAAINKHFIDVSMKNYWEMEVQIQQDQQIEDQLKINESIAAIAKVLNISSWSINTRVKNDLRISIWDSMKISGDQNSYYYLGTTTWLDIDFIYLVTMEKEKWLESLKVVTSSKEPQNEFCKKVRIEDSSKNLAVIYEFAPQCLSTCEKLQQVIIKWERDLSKEDLERISPACAESFMDK